MYSNVTPPTLPEWDSTAYPYYVLVFLYEKDQADWHQVKLYYSETPFTYNGTGVTTEGIVCLRTHDTGDSEWADEYIPLVTLNLQHGLSDTGLEFTRIRTNHDIKDSAGNIWLAAGSVTEAEEIVTEKWLRSFQAGLALGLAGKPLPIKKEPVAYLYNGVRLPKLPTVDEKYRYAVMLWSDVDGASLLTTLILSTTKLHRNTTLGIPIKSQSDGSYIRYTWGSIYTEFQPDENGEQMISAGGGISANGKPQWANYDVLKYGTEDLYLAASEPVPVYE